MPEELASRSVELPHGELRLLQPRESAELPDEGAVEWAPIAEYWSVLWRSGVALAREVDSGTLSGVRVVELGCGLGLPSIAAARRGADVLATDGRPEALALLGRNADLNAVGIETAEVDWVDADRLVERGPFDLVLAADVLYERESVPLLLSLLPRLAPEAWIADPGRKPAEEFLAEAARRWDAETRSQDIIHIHRLRFDGNGASAR